MPRGGKRPGAGRPRKEYEFRSEAKQMKSKAGRVEFTENEVLELQKLPYVRKATTKTISYTLDFKNKFWHEYNLGKTPPEIFADAGFDIDVLGDGRMYGLLTTLRRAKERGVPFKDGNEPTVKPKKKERSELNAVPKPPRLYSP